ncbi:MAG: hypothetical protein D6705_06405 [Deltaproteobacteria bacterium]|nr:MAG: hypothetical protein D6705_06405 [Deltaproteobacteria bacterium]
MSVPDTVEAILRRAAEGLGESLRQIARTDVEVRDVTVEEGGLEDGADVYLAKLELERPEPVETYLAISRPVAIAVAGLLVMMQEKVVREKVEQGEVTDDDLESLAECASHLSTVFDEALAEVIGEQHELGFVEGGVDAAAPAATFVRLRVELAIGDLASGHLFWLVPAEGFGEGQRRADAETPQAAGGVELSAEEMAAIREVAQGAAFAGHVAALVPVERVRGTWEQLAKEADVALEVVRTVFELRGLAAGATLEAVVVDGDVHPGGGISVVEIVRRWAAPNVATIMAASRPTRWHVAAALAAGAATYLVKPASGDDLRRALERASAGADPIGFGI